MKRAVRSTVLLLVVVSLVLAGGVHYWLSQSPASIAVVENALATDDLVLIGHINHSKITQLRTIVQVDEDPSPLPFPLLGLEPSLLTSLYNGEPDLKNNLDQLLFALHARENQLPSFSVVMKGRLNWSTIEQQLASTYDISKTANNSYTLIARLKQQQAAAPACPDDLQQGMQSGQQKAAAAIPFYVTLRDDWLVISASQGYPAELLARIASQSPAEQDLSKWKDFRQGKLLSAAVLIPNVASQSAKGLTGMIAQGAAAKNQEVSSLYTGLAVSYQPLGVEMAVEIEATDTWVKEKAQGLQQSLQAMAEQSAAYSPTFVELMGSVNVSHREKSLRLNVAASRKTLAKIPVVVEESLSSMFSMRPAAKSSGQTPPPAERIDESPWDYLNNGKLSSLPAFQIDGDVKPLLTNGNFAFDINAMAIDEKTGLVSLGVEAEAQLPEVEGIFWTDAGINFGMLIDDVAGYSGESLLRNELCVKDLSRFQEKNHEKAERYNQNNQRLQLTKTIRLSAGKKLSDIERIKGHIDFSVPVEVLKLTLPAVAGEVLEKQGWRVYVNSVNGGDITYQISGDTGRILDVRALNKQGKTLRDSGWFGTESKKTASFHGVVASLEVYIEQHSVNKRVAFELNGADLLKSRTAKKELWPRPKADRAYSLRQWNQFNKLNVRAVDLKKSKSRFHFYEPVVGRSNQSPFILQLYHDYKSSWGGQPRLQVLMPLVAELAHNRSVVEFVVDHPVEAGRKIRQSKAITPVMSKKDREVSYIGHVEVDGVPYVSVDQTFDLGLDKMQKLEAITGSVVLRFPEKVERALLDFPGLGETISYKQHQLTLRKISLGFIPRFELVYQGEEGKLVEIIAVSSTGEQVYPAQTDKRDGQLVVQFDLRDDLQYLELILASKQSVKKYPFLIQAAYSDGSD